MGNPELASTSYYGRGQVQRLYTRRPKVWLDRAKRKSDSCRKIGQIVTSMSEVRALAGEPLLTIRRTQRVGGNGLIFIDGAFPIYRGVLIF